MQEASQKRKEIESCKQELALKADLIRQLTEKVTEQEREMSRLQAEAEFEQQRSFEQSGEDDEMPVPKGIVALGRSTIHLKFKLKNAEVQKRKTLIESERAQQALEKYERVIVSSCVPSIVLTASKLTILLLFFFYRMTSVCILWV